MRVGHWDAAFGISGDMALGAALDAGASLAAVNAALAATGVPGLRVELGRAPRAGIDCARATVRWDGDAAQRAQWERVVTVPHQGPGAHAQPEGQQHHEGLPVAPGAEGAPRPAGDSGDAPATLPPGHAHAHAHTHAHASGAAPAEARGVRHVHRAFADVRRLLGGLPAPVRERAMAVFARLAEAEGRVHGQPPDAVHFHEVGGEDAIGDVVGTCAALVDLGIEALTVSVLPSGGGRVQAAHGVLPVPAPAVAELLRGYALWSGPVAAELVTPTGAALVAALALPAEFWPAMRLLGTGWGAGTREFPGHSNACRLVWGETSTPTAAGDYRRERLVELETHVDDQTPEGIGHVFECLFTLGALDVAVSAIGMKKQRPGVRLWALVPADLADTAARCLFTESTALGLRVREVERWSLEREVVQVATPYGVVGLKLGRLGGEVVNAAPEYEDCRRVAASAGVSLKRVLQAALGAAPWPPA